MDNLAQIMVTIGAIAGSTALWQFLSLRIKASQEKRKDEYENQLFPHLFDGSCSS